jgi:hypothetical protein
MATPEDDNVQKGLFEQDPLVDQLRPEPSAPPSDVVILEGLAGKSDREGWARLYFNRELTYYAEFRREDIVFTEAIPPDQPPMLGLKATRVGIKKDAVIEYTRATRAQAPDEFDLDVQLGAGQGRAFQPSGVSLLRCPNTGLTNCDQFTCHTCMTRCDQRTCQVTCTCNTQCNQQTCHTCLHTQCDQRTCQVTCTCNTQCNQQTCHTCQTQCHQLTCGTCDTCNRHVFTCGGGRCL